jgi:hypothetical protein
VILYHATENVYSVSAHNQAPEEAKRLLEEWKTHLHPGFSLVSIAQRRSHRIADAQDCRACRDSREALVGPYAATEIQTEETMTPEKKPEPGTKPGSAAPPASSGGRKPWTPKSPVEVVLDQIRKQEKKVAELQQELDAEKVTLNKLLQAKKVLES